MLKIKVQNIKKKIKALEITDRTNRKNINSI